MKQLEVVKEEVAALRSKVTVLCSTACTYAPEEVDNISDDKDTT